MDWCSIQGESMTHSLSTMKNGDKHRPYTLSWFGEGFNLIYMNVQVPLLTCPLTILLQMVSELVIDLCKLSDRCPCTPSVCYRSCWGTGLHSQVNPALAPSVLVNSCQQSLYSVNKNKYKAYNTDNTLRKISIVILFQASYGANRDTCISKALYL